MDILQVIETLGVPVAVAIGLAYALMYLIKFITKEIKADIKNLYLTSDPRDPTREIELHLTGNMSRYMWSINGVKAADADPIKLKYGERVRITLVNDTMMAHPIHLHGMWSELETGDPSHIPRKHTVMVQPGSKISYLVTADARGQWAYHCHFIFHMAGMFRQVTVS